MQKLATTVEAANGLFNDDLTMNADVYANLLKTGIVLHKTGVSKLNVMQQIRKAVLSYPHVVQVEQQFLEDVALRIFHKL